MKKVLVVLVVVVIAVSGFIASRPDTFTVARSSTVAASPEVAYAQIADFHKWDAWSPWAHKDPSMKTTYGGAPGAVGSTYAWEGNDDVGSGKMTITEVKAPNELHIKLEFLKPFASTNTTVFTFKPNGANTDVSWTMTGNNNFVAKAFGVFMDMDKMVGGDFEKGLAGIKQVSETAAAQAAVAAKAAAAPSPDAAAAPAAGAAPVAGAKPE